MPKWMKPSEEMPGDKQPYEVGDRLLMIVCERHNSESPIRPCLVILEAEDTGWVTWDDRYVGYGPQDSVLWAWEKDVCEIAYVLDLVKENSGE